MPRGGRRCSRRSAPAATAPAGGAVRRPAPSPTLPTSRLISNQGLRTTVIVGRPDLGAPDWRGNVPGRPMTAAEVSDVVAWLVAKRPATLSSAPGSPMTTPERFPRRWLLVKLGLLFNGVAGPAPRGARRPLPFLAGAPGPAGQRLGLARVAGAFPRRADPPGDVPEPGGATLRMGRPHSWPAGCATWRPSSSRSSPSTVPISAARCGGSRSRASSCVLATGAPTTPDGSRASGPPERGLFEYRYTASKAASFTSRPATCPRPESRPAWGEGPRRAPERTHRQLARAAPAGWRSRSGRSLTHPVPRDTASWFYVFGSAALTIFALPVVTGDPAGAPLRPLRRRSLEQPADPQSPGHRWVVHSRPARLGLELHGRHRAHPHGAGLPLRRVQVSRAS